MINWHSINPESIDGYPLTSETRRILPILVPPNYDENRDEPYPVAFILHGYGGRGVKYAVNTSSFGLSLADMLLNAMKAGELGECIVAFPDFSNDLGGSQYVNSEASGNYLDYLAHDLVDFIDENYNTHQSADYRAVLGHSSGGYGALICAMKKSDVFKYITSSAGDSFFEVLFPAHIKDVIIMAEKYGSLENFINEFRSMDNPGQAGQTAFNAIMICAMAACYAPNLTKKALYGDLFFDLDTGKVIPDVWAKYLAWDPIYMLDDHAHIAAIKNLKYLHLDAGKFDEYALQLGHRQIAAKLEQNKISFDITEYDGGHMGQSYRYVALLGRLLSAMGL